MQKFENTTRKLGSLSTRHDQYREISPFGSELSAEAGGPEKNMIMLLYVADSSRGKVLNV